MVRKKRVVFRAPLLSLSGYGTHSRQIFRWILSHNVDLICHSVPWGNTTWNVIPSAEEGIIGKILERSKIDSGPFDVSFQLQLPDEWDPNLAEKNVGISACVESDKCNPQWIECCNKMTAVVTPSEHIRKTLERTAGGGLRAPIYVIPEAYFDSIRKDDAVDLGLDFETNFNFLVVGQITGTNPWNDRKNIFLTLKWMCELFSDDSDVGIIVKSNSGRGTRIDRNITERTLKQVLNEVRKGPYPKVYLMHGFMTEREMASIYKHPSVRCFVSLTRGEGFGLPTLEAAASGIPVIATDWSGHLDFMKLGKFIPVSCDIKEVHESRVDNRIWIKGSKWAEPREEDAKKKLRRFREKPNVPEEWAKDLQKIILNTHSQESIEREYERRLGDLLI